MTSHRGHDARAGVGERLDHEEAPGRSTGSRLDFYKALSDFRGMFPSMSDDVIEAVLRANDGMVEATIDQLLAMSIDAPPGDSSTSDRPPTGIRSRAAHGDAEELSGAGDLLELLDASLVQPAALQRQASPATSRRATGTATLPSTLLSLDSTDDRGLAGMALQPPSYATAAAADHSPSAAVASASKPAVANVQAAAALQQQQQFEDPFADLFAAEGSSTKVALAEASARPDGAWPPNGQRAAGADVEQQQPSQACRPAHARDLAGAASATGHLLSQDVHAGTAERPSAAGAAARRAGDAPCAPATAAGSAAALDSHADLLPSHLPRPPKPLGISLSLPLPSAQPVPVASFASAGHAPELDRSVSPLSCSPSAEQGRANSSRQCLTLPVTPTRDLAGSASAGGGSSPQRAQLSPCSGGSASADISPGEIVDLLEQDDELPPSLPPPRRSSTRRKEQPRLQPAARAADGGGGSGSGSALSPELQAAADRWSVPLVGSLPTHFLRLEEEEDTPPPPRPPKPRSKLGLRSQDDSLLHAHQDGPLKAGRSRSQRNALIIGAFVATREAAAAAASAAASSDQHNKPSSERSRRKMLDAAQPGASSMPAGALEQQRSGGGGGGGGQRPRHHRRLPGERLSTNEMKMKIAENERRLQETCDLEDLDEETVRYLEDERLALIMQNEEFLREVKRNEDFMRTLEFEQQLLEARLVVDRSRRRATAQARAKTLDSFARRPSELDSEVVTAALHAGSVSPEAHSPQGGSWSQAAAGATSASSPPSSDTKPSLDVVGVHGGPRATLPDRSPPAAGSAGVLCGSGGSSSTVSQGGSSTHGSGGSSAHSHSSGSSELTSAPPSGSKADAGGGDSGGTAEFRRQLQGMGASSKKKFAVLAKNFFTRKVRRSHHPHNPIGLSRTPLGPSTLNLLDDCDDEDLELDHDNEASTCLSPAAMAAAHHAPYDD